MRTRNSWKSGIEARAIEFRNQCGYSAGEPINLNSLLIDKNVITVFKSMGNSISGMAMKVGENFKFMLINRDQTLARQNFTIGHELYHLFIQDNFKFYRCKTELFNENKHIEEKKADYFASCLLLPRQGLKLKLSEFEQYGRDEMPDEILFMIHQI